MFVNTPSSTSPSSGAADGLSTVDAVLRATSVSSSSSAGIGGGSAASGGASIAALRVLHALWVQRHAANNSRSPASSSDTTPLGALSLPTPFSSLSEWLQALEAMARTESTAVRDCLRVLSAGVMPPASALPVAPPLLLVEESGSSSSGNAAAESTGPVNWLASIEGGTGTGNEFLRLAHIERVVRDSCIGCAQLLYIVLCATTAPGATSAVASASLVAQVRRSGAFASLHELSRTLHTRVCGWLQRVLSPASVVTTTASIATANTSTTAEAVKQPEATQAQTQVPSAPPALHTEEVSAAAAEAARAASAEAVAQARAQRKRDGLIDSSDIVEYVMNAPDCYLFSELAGGESTPDFELTRAQIEHVLHTLSLAPLQALTYLEWFDALNMRFSGAAAAGNKQEEPASLLSPYSASPRWFTSAPTATPANAAALLSPAEVHRNAWAQCCVALATARDDELSCVMQVQRWLEAARPLWCRSPAVSSKAAAAAEYREWSTADLHRAYIETGAGPFILGYFQDLMPSPSAPSSQQQRVYESVAHFLVILRQHHHSPQLIAQRTNELHTLRVAIATSPFILQEGVLEAGDSGWHLQQLLCVGGGARESGGWGGAAQVVACVQQLSESRSMYRWWRGQTKQQQEETKLLDASTSNSASRSRVSADSFASLHTALPLLSPKSSGATPLPEHSSTLSTAHPAAESMRPFASLRALTAAVLELLQSSQATKQQLLKYFQSPAANSLWARGVQVTVTAADVDYLWDTARCGVDTLAHLWTLRHSAPPSTTSSGSVQPQRSASGGARVFSSWAELVQALRSHHQSWTLGRSDRLMVASFLASDACVLFDSAEWNQAAGSSTQPPAADTSSGGGSGASITITSREWDDLLAAAGGSGSSTLYLLQELNGGTQRFRSMRALIDAVRIEYEQAVKGKAQIATLLQSFPQLYGGATSSTSPTGSRAGSSSISTRPSSATARRNGRPSSAARSKEQPIPASHAPHPLVPALRLIDVDRLYESGATGGKGNATFSILSNFIAQHKQFASISTLISATHALTRLARKQQALATVQARWKREEHRHLQRQAVADRLNEAQCRVWSAHAPRPTVDLTMVEVLMCSEQDANLHRSSAGGSDDITQSIVLCTDPDQMTAAASLLVLDHLEHTRSHHRCTTFHELVHAVGRARVVVAQLRQSLWLYLSSDKCPLWMEADSADNAQSQLQPASLLALISHLLHLTHASPSTLSYLHSLHYFGRRFHRTRDTQLSGSLALAVQLAHADRTHALRTEQHMLLTHLSGPNCTLFTRAPVRSGEMERLFALMQAVHAGEEYIPSSSASSVLLSPAVGNTNLLSPGSSASSGALLSPMTPAPVTPRLPQPFMPAAPHPFTFRPPLSVGPTLFLYLHALESGSSGPKKELLRFEELQDALVAAHNRSTQHVWRSRVAAAARQHFAELFVRVGLARAAILNSAAASTQVSISDKKMDDPSGGWFAQAEAERLYDESGAGPAALICLWYLARTGRQFASVDALIAACKQMYISAVRCLSV